MRFESVIVLAGLALVSAQEASCPTITQDVIPRWCGRNCGNLDCAVTSTVVVPCGCPATVPTSTRTIGCQFPCPDRGCSYVTHRTLQDVCPEPTPSSTSSSTTSRPVITWDITQVPTLTTTTTTSEAPTGPPVCPRVTRTTRPAGCGAIQCPLPTCTEDEDIVVPCGCDGPSTILRVEGCQTACPGGCMTRTRTSVEACQT